MAGVALPMLVLVVNFWDNLDCMRPMPSVWTTIEVYYRFKDGQSRDLAQ